MKLKRDTDVRDTTPEWCRYLVMVDGTNGHDKYYEVRIDLNDEAEFVLTRRWGRRPDKGRGQIGVEYFTDMDRAIRTAEVQVREKERKGYLAMARPTAADSQVVDDIDDDIG